MENKFEVGQKVRVKKYKERPYHFNDSGKMDHLMGTVVTIKRRLTKGPKFVYGVYDKKHNYEWVFEEEDLEPINETIVIYRKNQEVIALDKTTGNKAIARCCPEDTFDFHYGAALALGRLIDKKKKEEPKYFSGLVQCIERDSIRTSVSCLTRGKLYEVKDGHIINDNGERSIPYISIDHMERSLGWTFKEIKEVKRPAKVGEFVKVINPVLSGGVYKKGDILRVIDYRIGCGAGYKASIGCYLFDEEYVVLEGYEDISDEIKVGDTVEVVDVGKAYPTYTDWFDRFCPEYASRYAYVSSIELGRTYEVLAKHLHENKINMLYAIRANKYSRVYLIGEDGIKKV